MDQVLREVNIGAMQREYLAGTHRCVAHAEGCALKDEPVIVGPAFAGGVAQSLVLLVGDDLEVGSIYSALSLARAKAGELVVLDQTSIERVVEKHACDWSSSCSVDAAYVEWGERVRHTNLCAGRSLFRHILVGPRHMKLAHCLKIAMARRIPGNGLTVVKKPSITALLVPRAFVPN
jgi:hypothetical protein